MSEMELKHKLNHLLNHWIEHNQGHAAEYEKWVLKAREKGFADVAEAVKKAGTVVQQANEELSRALDLLKKH